MAYIYQIINDINDKIYIGKTERSIQERWREHCKDYQKRDFEKRPLYSAMKKYGIDHFHIELVEETDEPGIRERYWIEQKRSFKYGYNATTGGDGSSYLDYDLIIATYQQTGSIIDTSKLCDCHEKSVSHILEANNVDKKTSAEVNIAKNGKIIHQYDLDGNYIRSYNSTHAAADALGKSGVSHIVDVCKGKRKSAYGYKWQYAI